MLLKEYEMGNYNIDDYELVGDESKNNEILSSHLLGNDIAENIEIENLKRLITPVEPKRKLIKPNLKLDLTELNVENLPQINIE